MVALDGSPTGILHRIGRRQDPLAFPPLPRTGESRFDDFPDSQSFSVLYTGERRACFFECMEDFIPDPLVPPGDYRGITADWLKSRRIAQLAVIDHDQTLQWLDLMDPRTLVQFRQQFRTEVAACGLPTFDASAAMSKCLPLTQAVGRWAHAQGLAGIKYRTRHDIDRECWAIFDRTEIIRIGTDQLITRNDPDFGAVIKTWAIPLPDPFPVEHL